MKNLFICIFSLLCIVLASCSQLKIMKATDQKTFGGRGGVIMTYRIEFRNTPSVQTEIDSVKSRADLSKLGFNFTKNENGSSEITFVVALADPEKCKTCRDVHPTIPNLTKGIIVYYKRGGKRSSFKAKKFKQLADINMP